MITFEARRCLLTYLLTRHLVWEAAEERDLLLIAPHAPHERRPRPFVQPEPERLHLTLQGTQVVEVKATFYLLLSLPLIQQLLTSKLLWSRGMVDEVEGEVFLEELL